MSGQIVDVPAALTQGRQDHRKLGEAVIKVFTKTPLTHPLLQVTVGGRNDANVDGVAFIAAQRPDFTFLQHTQ